MGSPSRRGKCPFTGEGVVLASGRRGAAGTSPYTVLSGNILYAACLLATSSPSMLAPHVHALTVGPHIRPATLRLSITSSPFVKMGSYAQLIALTFPDGPPLLSTPDANTLVIISAAMRLPSMPTTFEYTSMAVYASDAAVLPTVLPSAAAAASARLSTPPPSSPPACSLGNLSGSAAVASSGETSVGAPAADVAWRYYAITDERQLPGLMLQVVSEGSFSVCSQRGGGKGGSVAHVASGERGLARLWCMHAPRK